LETFFIDTLSFVGNTTGRSGLCFWKPVGDAKKIYYLWVKNGPLAGSMFGNYYALPQKFGDHSIFLGLVVKREGQTIQKSGNYPEITI
jgi:hypothetical protein